MIEKRKLTELFTIYNLEPQLRDIYVEDSNTKNFLEKFKHANSIENIKIYPIDFIDFGQIFESGQIRSSKTQKIIELSKLLSQKFPHLLSVTCIGKKGYSEYFGEVIDNEYLIYTDYHSMEVYLFNEDCISKYLNDFLPAFPFEANHILTQLGTVLKEIFLAILTRYYLKKPSEFLFFLRFGDYLELNKNNGILNFQTEEYLSRLLNESGLNLRLEEAKKLLNETRIQANKELKNYIVGPFYIFLLWVYLKRLTEDQLIARESLDTVLMIYLDYQKLNHKLFEHLIEKYNLSN